MAQIQYGAKPDIFDYTEGGAGGSTEDWRQVLFTEDRHC